MRDWPGCRGSTGEPRWDRLCSPGAVAWSGLGRGVLDLQRTVTPQQDSCRRVFLGAEGHVGRKSHIFPGVREGFRGEGAGSSL